jgi:hypothetical protein
VKHLHLLTLDCFPSAYRCARTVAVATPELNGERRASGGVYTFLDNAPIVRSNPIICQCMKNLAGLLRALKFIGGRTRGRDGTNTVLRIYKQD